MRGEQPPFKHPNRFHLLHGAAPEMALAILVLFAGRREMDVQPRVELVGEFKFRAYRFWCVIHEQGMGSNPTAQARMRGKPLQKFSCLLQCLGSCSSITQLDDSVCERRPHATDRRIWLLYLKPSAGAVLDTMWTIGDRTRAEALEQVSSKDRDCLIQALSTMRENLLAACSRANEGREDRHG